MTQGNPENPHLVDIFRTALDGENQVSEPQGPRIVVNGNSNVISLGGGKIVIHDHHQPGTLAGGAR